MVSSAAASRTSQATPISIPSSSSPLPPTSIRVHRPSVRRSLLTGGGGTGGATGAGSGAQKTFEPKVTPAEAAASAAKDKCSVSLESIVQDYLFSQHSLCRNPMATCPEFDLLLPHKCPDPRSKNSAPINFSMRYARRNIFPPFGGPEGFKLDRKLVYSRYRPMKTFRTEWDDPHQDNLFTCCAICPEDNFLLVGTYTGDLKLFNIHSAVEEATYTCHDSQINHIQYGRDGRFVLTSSAWRAPYSTMWSMGDIFESKLVLTDEEYIEFSKVSQDKIIGTKESVATIYDLASGAKVRELKPQISNNYSRNRATFDPTDELVLNDGVLYDMRMGSEIRKLDKLNQSLSGVFHPNGLEILSNSQVWDLRTFQLIKTVQGLDQCEVVFTNSGDIIYGVCLEQDTDDGEKYESAFKTFDAADYSSIATIETKKSVLCLSTSSDDLQLAVVENSFGPAINEESVVRLYEVGRHVADEEEGDEDDGHDDDDADGGDDDDESDEDGDDEDAGSGDASADEFEDLLGGGSNGSNSSDDSDYDANADDDDDEEEEEGSAPAAQESNGSWEDLEESEEIGGDARSGDDGSGFDDSRDA